MLAPLHLDWPHGWMWWIGGVGLGSAHLRSAFSPPLKFFPAADLFIPPLFGGAEERKVSFSVFSDGVSMAPCFSVRLHVLGII